MAIINPYAIYVFCDGAMNYDSRNTGGVGYEIVFPDSVDLENIRESLGRFERGNIERIELEGLIQGMEAILDLYARERQNITGVNTITFITDRFRLNDNEGTNPYRIKEWRKNKWCNHEGKAIKNHDLLDILDKKRKKISEVSFCRVTIEYRPRKQNKIADKLAKAGKNQPLAKEEIAIKGTKVGKRKHDGAEVLYKTLIEKDEIHINVFLKTPVGDQWEISTEILEGQLLGKKLKIYTDNKLAAKLQRGNEYKIKLKKIFSHHVIIYRTLEKIKKAVKNNGLKL